MLSSSEDSWLFLWSDFIPDLDIRLSGEAFSAFGQGGTSCWDTCRVQMFTRVQEVENTSMKPDDRRLPKESIRMVMFLKITELKLTMDNSST